MTAVHRFRQGMLALLAFSKPVDYELAASYLNAEQLALFCSMRRSEQLHSLNVLRTVLAQEPTTPHDLAVAALMHDVGKARYPVRLWQKVLVVLVKSFTPAVYRRLSAGDERSVWRRPFVVYRLHPAWSAEMLQPTKVSEVALWLIAHHQESEAYWTEHPNAPLLRRLQIADDSN